MARPTARTALACRERALDSTLEGAPASEPRPAPESAAGVRVRFWGTRGSIPSPGPATARYGGNTSCVEIVADNGERLVLDAGSGIRALGDRLLAAGNGLDEVVLLTHFHWDHIQGFPFFAPLYRPDARVRIVAPLQEAGDAQSLFAGQMGPVYFPVPFETLSARVGFEHLNEGTWTRGAFRVTAMRVRHPSFTVGYRIEVGGRSVVYVPDNELDGDPHGSDAGWPERFEAFVRGADLLIHDAMYTPDEHAARLGWGHSTFDQATRLAVRAGAARLLFFHHAPERTDDDLEAVVQRVRGRVLRDGGTLEVGAANESEEIFLPVNAEESL